MEPGKEPPEILDSRFRGNDRGLSIILPYLLLSAV
jgi:hypothetical protein